MWGTSDRPLLTLADVRAWQVRKREIDGAIQALRDEDAQLLRKLEAVQVIFGDLPVGDGAEEAGSAEAVKMAESAPSESVATEDGVGQGMSFADTVLLAISMIGGAPLPKVIREWLREHGDTATTRERADKQYFYTTLMRHTKYGRLIKVGEGYSLPPSSAQAEAGGVAPPADSLA